jgi:hypothetical protein
MKATRDINRSEKFATNLIRGADNNARRKFLLVFAAMKKVNQFFIWARNETNRYKFNNNLVGAVQFEKS